uniref:Flavonoid 3',5'-hydroxylase 1 n=1 Tax=Aegilops tauschii TaxID=37682 RepID=R7W498_AEGTA
MQLAAVCTDPWVLSGTALVVLVHLVLRHFRSGGRRLPPGPRGFPILGALPLVGPTPHTGLAALARKHGPVMYLKMGTCGVVVASSPAAARQFLKVQDARFADRPAVASAVDITYKEMITLVQSGSGLFNISDFVPALSRFDLQGVQAKLRKIHLRFDDMITSLLDEHSATAKQRQGRPDFIDKLRASMADNKDSNDADTISEVNVKGFVFDMFTAGTDTASIIAEWAMAEMIKNPSITARAQEEMDRVVGRGRRLEESDVASLPYLQAVCKEAMRLHPSTPLSIPHFSAEECEVDGYHIPRNTQLLVNIWAIGRDEGTWEDPLEFRPERFLSGPTANVDALGNHFELIPFGAGRRICVGKLAGMVFVQYFLGMLVHAFEWRLPEGEKLDMEEQFGLTMPKAVPLRAIVTPRLAPAAYA